MKANKKRFLSVLMASLFFTAISTAQVVGSFEIVDASSQLSDGSELTLDESIPGPFDGGVADVVDVDESVVSSDSAATEEQAPSEEKASPIAAADIANIDNFLELVTNSSSNKETSFAPVTPGTANFQECQSMLKVSWWQAVSSNEDDLWDAYLMQQRFDLQSTDELDSIAAIIEKSRDYKFFLEQFKNISGFDPLNLSGEVFSGNESMHEAGGVYFAQGAKSDGSTGYWIIPDGAGSFKKITDAEDCEAPLDRKLRLKTSAGAFCFNSNQARQMEVKEFKKVTEDIKERLESMASESIATFEKVKRCEGYRTLMKGYEKPGNTEYSTAKSGKSNASFDGTIQCQSTGYETQDYPSCEKLVSAYNGVFIGRKAMETVQGYQYMDHQLDQQNKVMAEGMTNPTAALEVQKSMIDKKSSMAKQRAATETAALGVLFTYYKKMPDIESLHATCSSAKFGNVLDKYNDTLGGSKNKGLLSLIKGLGNTYPLFKLRSNQLVAARIEKGSDECSRILDVESGQGNAFLQNGGMKQVVEKAMVDAGLNVATMLGQGALLDKQAGMIGDAIGRVKNHDPEKELQYIGTDILAQECDVDANAEGCLNSDYSQAVDFSRGSINVGGNGFSTGSGDGELDEINYNATTDRDNSSRDQPLAKAVGAGVASVNKGGGIQGGGIGAAAVKAGGSPSAGGGGGSGGGGGAAAPNSNAGGSRNGGSNGGNYKSAAKGLAYSGGGGSLSFSGGRKAIRKKSKSKNPFSKLFKKGKRRGKVMNFRGLASKGIGTKGGSIFKMISSRYSSVSKKGSLLEYKAVK